MHCTYMSEKRKKMRSPVKTIVDFARRSNSQKKQEALSFPTGSCIGAKINITKYCFKKSSITLRAARSQLFVTGLTALSLCRFALTIFWKI